MKPILHRIAAAALIAAACSSVGCDRPTDASAASAAASPGASGENAPIATAVAIRGVELGPARPRSDRATSPKNRFAPGDTVVATIRTATRDAQTRVPGRLSVRWFDPAGRVFNQEARTPAFHGEGVYDFRVAEPAGWKPGTYRIEVSLDGARPVVRAFVVS
ncbi:hypothetical protein K4L06_04400 [Lysobacter sp. BMK333-48F3]|uniref:hypothetical protein n=1 Tax=Lysobacter sp. BMK333-48F3 TaxID=2867962 RepID=UPI001C8B3404|nr:hypothetical protein [Lysobacter sp. BMK333-48F3]MBX9400542.1 hypothetical protein [Lysobacter sp. BMK333-48F3]